MLMPIIPFIRLSNRIVKSIHALLIQPAVSQNKHTSHAHDVGIPSYRASVDENHISPDDTNPDLNALLSRSI